MSSVCLTATLGSGQSSSPAVKWSWALGFSLPMHSASGSETCVLSSGILPVASFLQADLRDSPALFRTTDQGETQQV